MENDKGKLSLPEKQYKSFEEYLTEALHQIDKEKYFQIKSERVSNYSVQNDEDTFLKNKKYVSLEEETHNYSSFFSYPLSFVKGVSSLVQRGASFAIENPMQAITMGLAFQAASVAAKSAFALPPQFQIAKGNSIISSAIAPLSNGNALVVWDDDQKNFENKIFGRVLNAVGIPVTSTFRIDTTMGYNPTVDTRLMNGNVFVAWHKNLHGIISNATNYYVLNGRIIDPVGNPVTNEFRINDNTLGDSFNPSVAPLSNGNAFVAYSTLYKYPYGGFRQVVWVISLREPVSLFLGIILARRNNVIEYFKC